MAVTTFASREFNQNTGRAKIAARHGPVIITERGRPAHVLMTYENYQRLAGDHASIVDLLSVPAEEAGIPLETTSITGRAEPPAENYKSIADAGTNV